MSYKNKEDQKAAARKHYKDNKNLYIERAKESKKRTIIWFKEIKKLLCCMKCGENRPACLEFHHPEGVEKNQRSMIKVLLSKGRKGVLKEIESCDILCSNCHKDLHYGHLFV